MTPEDDSSARRLNRVPISRRAFGQTLGLAGVAGALHGIADAHVTDPATPVDQSAELCDLSAVELAATDPAQGRLGARGDGRPPGADRARQPARQRHRHARRRARDGRRGACRRSDRRAAARSASLHGLPVAHKDLVDTAGIRTTRGSLFYRDTRADARRADRHAHARGRRDHLRQDEHAGVRRRIADVQQRVRRDAQSLRRHQDLRRQQRRRGRGAGVRDGADRRRQRHRRLAAQSRGVLQRRRLASVAGPRAERVDGRGRRSRCRGRWRARSPMWRSS